MWVSEMFCDDHVVVDELSQRLVPAEVWALAEPLIPQFAPRPRGGGTTPVDDCTVFTAVVFVLTNGCAWRYLPPSFGVTVPTAHRRFTEWTKAGLWRRLHCAVLDERVVKAWSTGHVRSATGSSNAPWPDVRLPPLEGGTHDRAEPRSIEIGDASAFKTSGHLAAYAGIAPLTRSSGSSIKGEYPARTGNHKLKRAFFLARVRHAIRPHQSGLLRQD